MILFIISYRTFLSTVDCLVVEAGAVAGAEEEEAEVEGLLAPNPHLRERARVLRCSSSSVACTCSLHCLVVRARPTGIYSIFDTERTD